MLDNLSSGFRKNLSGFPNQKNLNFIHGDIRDFEIVKKCVKHNPYARDKIYMQELAKLYKKRLVHYQFNLYGLLESKAKALNSNSTKLS